MNWDAIGAIGDAIGAAGVIVTLLYLAAQIKQSGENARTQSYHLAVDQLISGVLQKEFWHLLMKSEREELSPEEYGELFPPLNCFVFSLEILYYLWRKGRVDEEMWQHAFLNNEATLRMKMPQAILSERKGKLSDDFNSFLKRRMQQSA